MKPLVTLMVDSGAYSAWRRDITISIDEYVKFIKRNKELIYSYVNMDVIPGSKGRLIRTPEAVEKSARMSYENLQRIKDKGLSPIPVFHQGESFDWLERLIDDHEPYIGISPYLRSHPKELHRWLDRCFAILAKRQGSKPIKTHGFGVTNLDAIIRYPWTTADSTSWAIKAGYGQVCFPALGSKEPDFSRMTIIRFSPRAVLIPTGVRYGMLGPNEQLRIAIDKYVYEQIGFPIESICNLRTKRQDLNIIYFQGLQRHTRNVRQTDKFDIIFATLLRNADLNVSLTQSSANFRLLSYFELRDTKPSHFERFITSGLSSPNTKRCNGYDWNNESYLVRRYNHFIERMKENQCAEPTS